jgi:hypothetical protein
VAVEKFQSNKSNSTGPSEVRDEQIPISTSANFGGFLFRGTIIGGSAENFVSGSSS